MTSHGTETSSQPRKFQNPKSHQVAEFLIHHEIQPVQKKEPGNTNIFYYLLPWRCTATRAVSAKQLYCFMH
jgi:hypothetical protein